MTHVATGYFNEGGPWFGWNGCLGAWTEPLNGGDHCISNVESPTFTSTRDKDGNSILTGKSYSFTAVEIEVFKL